MNCDKIPNQKLLESEYFCTEACLEHSPAAHGALPHYS